MRYLIEHETRVGFPDTVREHQVELRLEPVTDRHQRLLSAHIESDPAAEVHRYRDAFGNEVHHFGIVAAHDHLTTRLTAEVECLLQNPFDFTPPPPAREQEWIAHALRDVPRLWDYLLHRSPMTPDPAGLDLADCPARDPDAGVTAAVQRAMEWMGETLAYAPGATHMHSALAELLEKRAGVCQDFAHLLITIVRGWGFPARYVMGYHYPGDDAAAAAPATHAWVEVLVPGAQWLGFDPTHRLLVNEHYIKVAVGRDARDANPQRGSFKGGDSSAPPDVSLRITRR